MSKHFVSIKINAEKGEGKALREKYGVRGFPTLLIIDAKGEEVDRIVGFRPPDKFIAILKPIIAGNSFAALKKKSEANPDDLTVAMAFAGKLEERRKNKEAEAIYRRVVDSKKATDPQRVMATGRLAIMEYMSSRSKNVSALEKFVDESKSSDAAVDQAQILFSHYQREKKNERAVEMGNYLLHNGLNKDAQFLNGFAWFLATNDLHLKRALKLARIAAKLSPKSAPILDTLAEAYHRNGEHGKAVATQKKAIEFTSEKERPQYVKRLEEFEAALKTSESSSQ